MPLYTHRQSDRIEPTCSRDDIETVLDAFSHVRQQTLELIHPLDGEDYNLQSMPEASPPKWHLAHTTWFFDKFVLETFTPGHAVHPDFDRLFNSYYAAVGPRLNRGSRGLLSRPTMDEVLRYRREIDAAIAALLSRNDVSHPILDRIELGLHHEQQHQELLLTDIHHAFASNPLRPVYRQRTSRHADVDSPRLFWVDGEDGIVEIGHSGPGFAFDNEGPPHRVFLEPFQIASRLTTNAEYLAFMEDGGYEREDLWLSAGWDASRRHEWRAPLYWEKVDGQWCNHTLTALFPVIDAEPVCHVSFYEADAYARWVGARLATEFEWESIARHVPIKGNFLESNHLRPRPPHRENALVQIFGDTWEWTQSAYQPYPGYQPLSGALGEYNGKFMSQQMVLRGGSCVTPRDHIRPTYRNFFPPDARWQFTGIRLARSGEARP